MVGSSEFAFKMTTCPEGDSVSWRYTFTLTFNGEVAAPTMRRVREIRALADEIREWCQDQFGMNRLTGDWDHTPYGIFYFDNEEAAFAFRMRWC